jgi:hypothetical protein
LPLGAVEPVDDDVEWMDALLAECLFVHAEGEPSLVDGIIVVIDVEVGECWPGG